MKAKTLARRKNMNASDTENRKSTELNRKNSPGRRPLNGRIDPKTMSNRTKENIIAVATREFADKGYSGASINEIANRTKTSKRMLYYHFGGKLNLYTAVLEAAYQKLKQSSPRKNANALERMEPMDALRAYAEESFVQHLKNLNSVKLILNENLNKARVLQTSENILANNKNNLQVLEKIVQRGRKSGVMRPDFRIVDLYFTIVGVSFHAISNRYSIRAIFGVDSFEEDETLKRRKLVGELACRYVSI